MNENKTNSNLEFRKIKSLKYLYEVNENGTIFRNVKSKKQNKIFLDMHHSDKGYYMTFIHVGGRSKDSKTIRIPIHRVVAECWLGDKPDGYEIDHIDRNSHNNHYSNLRYVTRSEQMKNRDHSRIGARGTKNLEEYVNTIKKPVRIIGFGEDLIFESRITCARYLAERFGKEVEHIRGKLKAKRSHIYGYDIIYF